MPNQKLKVGQLKSTLPQPAKLRKTDSAKPSPRRTKDGKRILAQPTYKSFKMSKRIKHVRPKITGSYRLFGQSLRLIWHNKKLFLVISIIYILMSLIFVKGFASSTSVSTINDTLSNLSNTGSGKLQGSLTVFGSLLSSTGSAPTELAGAYQGMLLIVFSLALIWSLREVVAVRTVTIKHAFYNSMFPLVPFLLVLLIIGLQLVPFILGGLLYSFVFSGGLAVTALEQVLWGLLILLMMLWSFYIITSSIFAAYIVTLPDMTPMKALRSARGLVRYRRLTVMRKVLFLPLAVFIILAAIILPVILLIPAAAEWIVFVLSLSSLVVIHSYMYNLYRELLR